MRTIRITAALSALICLIAAQGELSAQQSAQTDPNIIIIQADDLGFGDLSVYGQTHFRTPSLDQMASEGMRFTQYYAGSTLCAPSRAALMTGYHTGHLWIRGNLETPLRASDVTMAMILRDAGYRTAVIGKWGLGRQGTSGQPDRKGFEYQFGFLDHRHAHRQFTDHLYRNSQRIDVPETAYANDLFTREARDFINRPDRRPFFLYLNYTVPHAELRVPEDSLAPLRNKFPETPYVDKVADSKPRGPSDDVSLGYRSQPTPKAAYAAMIVRMDRDIGTLLTLLKSRGIDSRTIVMFISDNGPHEEGGGAPRFFDSAGGLRGIKRDLYEGGLRVPMIARWPGVVPAGRISSVPFAAWDILPTVADIVGVKPPAGIDGVSMAAALHGGTPAVHDFFYWEFHERGFQQAVRMGRWKAVRLAQGTPLELYNLAADPDERNNVAKANPAVIARVETYLKTARVDNPLYPTK
jgi:arylsulfatase A-like enzyme